MTKSRLILRRHQVSCLVHSLLLVASAAACGGRALEYVGDRGTGGRAFAPSTDNGTGGISRTPPSEPRGRAGAGSAVAPSQGDGGALASAGSGGAQNLDPKSLARELEAEGAAVREVGVGSREVQKVAISAPILPRLSILYAAAGENYPKTESSLVQLTREVSLTYSFLLRECAREYPKITLWTPGAPALSLAERLVNQEQVAECAYNRFFAKPYFIPQLLEDVNVCGVVLGQDWRLLDEADLANMTEEDFAFFESMLAAPGTLAADIFGLNVYLSTKSGIQEGTLAPKQTPRVQAIAAADPKQALQKPIGVRCIRELP